MLGRCEALLGDAVGYRFDLYFRKRLEEGNRGKEVDVLSIDFTYAPEVSPAPG